MTTNGLRITNAAVLAKIDIPVMVYTKEYIEEIWGTDEWIHLVANPPLIKG